MRRFLIAAVIALTPVIAWSIPITYDELASGDLDGTQEFVLDVAQKQGHPQTF
jgi:hypothetical protein